MVFQRALVQLNSHDCTQGLTGRSAVRTLVKNAYLRVRQALLLTGARLFWGVANPGRKPAHRDP